MAYSILSFLFRYSQWKNRGSPYIQAFTMTPEPSHCKSGRPYLNSLVNAMAFQRIAGHIIVDHTEVVFGNGNELALV
jgi:hypothetical protein